MFQVKLHEKIFYIASIFVKRLFFTKLSKKNLLDYKYWEQKTNSKREKKLKIYSEIRFSYIFLKFFTQKFFFIIIMILQPIILK